MCSDLEDERLKVYYASIPSLSSDFKRQSDTPQQREERRQQDLTAKLWRAASWSQSETPQQREERRLQSESPKDSEMRRQRGAWSN